MSTITEKFDDQGWPTASRVSAPYEEYTSALLCVLKNVRKIDAINLIPPYEWLWPATLSKTVADVHSRYWKVSQECLENKKLQNVRRITVIYTLEQLTRPLHDGIWKSAKIHCYGQPNSEEWLDMVARDIKPQKSAEKRYKRFVENELNANRTMNFANWNRKIAKHILKSFADLHTNNDAFYLALRPSDGKRIFTDYLNGGGHVESVIYQGGECMMGIRRIPSDYDDEVEVHYYHKKNHRDKAHLTREKRLRDQLVQDILNSGDWRIGGRIRDLVKHIK